MELRKKFRVGIGLLIRNVSRTARHRVARPRTKAPRVAQKNDPRHVAFARELRDRYLEALRDDPTVLLPRGKYDLCRQLPGHASIQAELVRVQPQLPAAA